MTEKTNTLSEVKHLSVGVACDCLACISGYGYADKQLFQDDIESQEVLNEGFFSGWSCDCCGSSLGGNRYYAHGFIDNELVHLEVCTDCVASIG